MVKDVSYSIQILPISRMPEEKSEDTWSLFLASPLVLVFTFWILAIIFVLLRHIETTNFIPYHSASPPGLELDEKGGVSTIYSVPDKLHSLYVRELVSDKVTSFQRTDWDVAVTCSPCSNVRSCAGLKLQTLKFSGNTKKGIFLLHLEAWLPCTTALYEHPFPYLTTIGSKRGVSCLGHRQKQAFSQKCADR